MDFYAERASNSLVRGRGLNSVVTTAAVKARDRIRLDLYFSNNGVAEDLEADSLLVFALKTGYEEASGTLALVTDWELVAEGTGHYRAWLNLNTEPLDTAVGDQASITALGEFSWSEDGDNWESSNTLTVTIRNDVYKGVETTPLELPTPADWLEDQLDAILIALGVEKYANLAAANAALGIGLPYYDLDLGTLKITTA